MYSDYGGYDSGFGEAMAAFWGCYGLFVLLMVALMIWLWWRILTRAGYSGWLSLLNLVPLGTLVLMFILAFGNWPAFSRPAPSAQQSAYAPPAPQPTAPTVPLYTPPAPPAAPAPPAPPAPGAEPPAAPPAPPSEPGQ